MSSCARNLKERIESEILCLDHDRIVPRYRISKRELKDGSVDAINDTEIVNLKERIERPRTDGSG